MADPNHDPALAPSADSPPENRRKLALGHVVLLVLCGLGILAFLLYLLIGLRAVSSG